MLVGLKWRLALVLVGVALWSHPGVAGKIDRFTDKEGTLHISNKDAGEPIKLSEPPETKPPAPTAAPPASPARSVPQHGRLAPIVPGTPDPDYPATGTEPHNETQPPGDEAIERGVQANQGLAAPPGAPPRLPQGPFNRRRKPPPQPEQ
jgi:hypothetical protein